MSNQNDQADERKVSRFFMRVDDAFMQKVDEWRRTQPDLPNRSEAIRRLVEAGLLNPGFHESFQRSKEEEMIELLRKNQERRQMAMDLLNLMEEDFRKLTEDSRIQPRKKKRISTES